jgi:hypothetical protein
LVTEQALGTFCHTSGVAELEPRVFRVFRVTKVTREQDLQDLKVTRGLEM